MTVKLNSTKGSSTSPRWAISHWVISLKATPWRNSPARACGEKYVAAAAKAVDKTGPVAAALDGHQQRTDMERSTSNIEAQSPSRAGFTEAQPRVLSGHGFGEAGPTRRPLFHVGPIL